MKNKRIANHASHYNSSLTKSVSEKLTTKKSDTSAIIQERDDKIYTHHLGKGKVQENSVVGAGYEDYQEWIDDNYKKTYGNLRTEANFSENPTYENIPKTYYKKTGPFEGMGPKGYVRSDERIFEEICETFTHDSWLDATDLVVEVQDGEVILHGKVNSKFEKRLAIELVEPISGVKNVENRIRINGL